MKKTQMSISKIKIELFDIIEQQDLLQSQYRQLEELKKQKIQELYAARKKIKQLEELKKE